LATTNTTPSHKWYLGMPFGWQAVFLRTRVRIIIHTSDVLHVVHFVHFLFWRLIVAKTATSNVGCSSVVVYVSVGLKDGAGRGLRVVSALLVCLAVSLTLHHLARGHPCLYWLLQCSRANL